MSFISLTNIIMLQRLFNVFITISIVLCWKIWVGQHATESPFNVELIGSVYCS